MKKIGILFSIILVIVLVASAFVFRNLVSYLPSTDSIGVEDISGCDSKDGFPGQSRHISEIKKGKSGYFPLNAFYHGYPTSDDFVNDWYGKHLSVMKEKSFLDVADAGREVYRFLWLRTFHHPVIVRTENDGESFRVSFVETSGHGGYEPGRVLKQGSRLMTLTEWCSFKGLLASADYWDLSTVHTLGQAEDGAQWIVEGVKDNHYHVVDRQSGQEIYEACIFLLDLSGRDTKALGNELY